MGIEVLPPDVNESVIADAPAGAAPGTSHVFYEIGVAHTLGRTVILITQNGDDVPFDLQAIRYIKYAYTPPGMTVFERTLAQTLKAELDASARGKERR